MIDFLLVRWFEDYFRGLFENDAAYVEIVLSSDGAGRLNVIDPKVPDDYEHEDFGVQWVRWDAGADVNALLEAEKARLLALGEVRQHE